MEHGVGIAGAGIEREGVAGPAEGGFGKSGEGTGADPLGRMRVQELEMVGHQEQVRAMVEEQEQAVHQQEQEQEQALQGLVLEGLQAWAQDLHLME